MENATAETVRFDTGYQIGYGREQHYADPETIAARLAEMQRYGASVESIAADAAVDFGALRSWMLRRAADTTAHALGEYLRGIDAEVERREAGFVRTPSAMRQLQAYAQARKPRDSSGKRSVALIYGASGTGRTTTAEYLARSDKGVVYVMVDGECRKWSTLMKKVDAAIAGHYGHSFTGESAQRRIVRQLGPGGLIIFDHAQLLTLSTMESLLSFPDSEEIAIAFVGTAVGYSAVMDPKAVQIKARVSSACVFLNLPERDDIEALMQADGIIGREERNFMFEIAGCDGGLHYYRNTLVKAREIAATTRRERLELADLKMGALAAGAWFDAPKPAAEVQP